MPFVRAGQLARITPVAMADDPIGLVAENLRVAGCGTIAVVDRLVTGGDAADPDGRNWRRLARQAHVVGVVDERDLSAAVLPILEGREYLVGQASVPVINEPTGSEACPTYPPLGEVTSFTARDVMRGEFGIVPSLFSLHNALLTLNRYGCSALPVIDPDGGYAGMISRADIVSALGRNVRPPVVGGMATPLGVFLTTGTLSAGAPPLGIFLSGVLLGLCMIVTQGLLLALFSVVSADWAAMFVSGRLGALSGGGGANFGFTALHGLCFLLAMRALPLSGTHAAEHQTVWAIERGVPLEPDIVKQMPRAHPRCGTNLVALGGLIAIVFQHLPSFDGTTITFALLLIYFGWNEFGSLLQIVFTTKPASEKQLASGIKAGKELLEKYQAEPHVMAPFGARLFRSGLLYSAGGMMVVLVLWAILESYFSQWILGRM